MKIRAAVLSGMGAPRPYADSKPLSIEPLELDPPGPGEVLIRIAAVVNTARFSAGSSAAVIGLGGVGLASVLGAIAAGARDVVAIDLDDEKLAFARQLGATATINAKDADAVDQVKSAVKGGVEYSFELAGSVRALELAYKVTKRGGTTVTAG